MNVNGAAIAVARTLGSAGQAPAPGASLRADGGAGSPRAGGLGAGVLVDPTTMSAEQANAIVDAPSGVDGVVSLEVPELSAAELHGMQAAAGGIGMSLHVKNKPVDVRVEMQAVDAPVDTSRGDAIEAERDQLQAALSSGKLDPVKWLKARRKLHALELLLDLIRRAEEKQRIIKKLLKLLMMGVLTPQMISLAKQFGLERVLKEAIQELVKSGSLTPQAAAAMSGMLAQAGIAMPVLDDVVVRHERKAQGQIDAARAARGIRPANVSASSNAQNGVTLLAPGSSASVL